MNQNTTFEENELQQIFSQIALPLKERSHLGLKKKKIIVIAGPTCVGKTKHSLAVAEALGGEIISADSIQVYKGMDIGTAKIKIEEQVRIPHHLIDIRTIQGQFNVVDFYREANKAIRDILLRDKVPIVVGGTGFYIHALIYGPPQGPPSDAQVRTLLEKDLEKQGTEALFERLSQIDPEYAKTITKADRQKIIRALEIISLTNKKVSDFPKVPRRELPYNFRCWFLYKTKEVLYPLIEMRCDEMIAEGFIEEVRELIKEGLVNNLTAANAIGYRQCIEFLQSPGSPDDFIAFVSAFKQASRRYAKRQFTWFRREPLFRWLNVEDLPFEKSTEILIQDYELNF